MKFQFASIATALLVAATRVVAEVDRDQQAAASAAAQQEPEAPTSIQFVVDYSIKEYPDVANTDVAEFTNGDLITLEYNVVNNEEEDITVVGVGGTFRDPVNNKIRTNLTAATIGPVVVSPGQQAKFDQKINLELLPENYLLTPQLFLAFHDELKLVQARGQLATVVDVPISFFNPQLLFLELVFALTVAGLLYAAYQIWGVSYFQGTAPIRSKPISRPVAVSSGSAKSVNNEWLPPTHLQQRKKSRKAY